MTGNPVRLGAPPPSDCNLCECGRVVVGRGAHRCRRCAGAAAGEERRARADRARVMLAQGMSIVEIAERLDVTSREVRLLLDPELGHVQQPMRRSVR